MNSQFQSGLISVIVPAYNVKEYIVECIESICKQTYTLIEIIIVDDGSTDGTGEICDSLKDSRIKVVHQKNKGLSGARNTGLSMAVGEYISFIDSDDTIKPEMYESMIDALKFNKADIVACGVEYVRCDNGDISFSGCTGDSIFLDYKSSLKYLGNKYLFNVWNKLYRHECIETLRFEEGIVCEDIGFTSRVFMSINNSVYIDKPFYVYKIKRPGSSGIRFDKRKIPAIDDYEFFISYLISKGYKSEAELIRYNQLALIKSLYYETDETEKKERRELYKLFVKKMEINQIFSKHAIAMIGFIFFPHLFRNKYQRMNKR